LSIPGQPFGTISETDPFTGFSKAAANGFRRIAAIREARKVTYESKKN
jgi:hypothetical protein